MVKIGGEDPWLVHTTGGGLVGKKRKMASDSFTTFRYQLDDTCHIGHSGPEWSESSAEKSYVLLTLNALRSSKESRANGPLVALGEQCPPGTKPTRRRMTGIAQDCPGRARMRR